MRRKPLGALGGGIVLGMLLLATFAPWLAPHSPEEFIQGGSARLQPPSWRFPMGTDNLGRDILSRVIYGARLSMLVGFVSTFFGTGIGAVLALFTAYWGDKWDLLAQRLMDILWAFPSLVIAIVIIAVLGRSTTNLIIAIAIVVIPEHGTGGALGCTGGEGNRLCPGRQSRWRQPVAHYLALYCPQLPGALSGYSHGQPGGSHYYRSLLELPGARRAPACPVVGTRSLWLGAKICRAGPLDADYARPCHQPDGIRV